jgi:trigger factor
MMTGTINSHEYSTLKGVIMKAQLSTTAGLQRKLEIEVPKSVVANSFSKVYETIQRQVEIKGFRKGKAPLSTIKSMYKDRVASDVAQDLIQMHYTLALKEQSITPINYPEFEFEDPSENGDFKFSALFEVRPTVNAKKWEGLEVEKEKFVFKAEQMEKSIENIRNSHAKQVDVTEARPALMSDVAIIDFEGFVDGKPLEHGAGKDHPLELGAKQFIDGFEDGIVGMKIGETKTLNLKFPDPYNSPELAGKAVEFKVKLNALKSKQIPAFDQELMTQIGSKQTPEEYKKTMQSDIEKSETKRIEDAFKNRLLKKLVQANPVEVPNALLAEQKKGLIEDFKNRMQQQGMTPEAYEDYVKKWDADFSGTAKEMIQSSFLIDQLATDHNLQCKSEDLDAKFAEYAQQTGIEETRVREWYSRPEQMNRLTYMITEDKVIKMVSAKAKIKEVDAKDLKEEAQ